MSQAEACPDQTRAIYCTVRGALVRSSLKSLTAFSRTDRTR
jgi:hypothetical protein